MTSPKLFTAEDFGDDILDAEDIQAVAADTANARLAPLVEALEELRLSYDDAQRPHAAMGRLLFKALDEYRSLRSWKGQVREGALPFPGANKPECDNPNGPCYCGAWHSQEDE